jgi:hypothetical protein
VVLGAWESRLGLGQSSGVADHGEGGHDTEALNYESVSWARLAHMIAQGAQESRREWERHKDARHIGHGMLCVVGS